MVKTKRALALLLTVAMTLSCIVLPASAETEPTAPCTISLSNAEATVTAEKGSDVTVNVDISGLGDGEGWNALTLYAYYDSAILTYKKQVPGDAFKKARDAVQDEGGAVSSQVSAGRDIQDADQDGDKDEYCISIASVATNAESDPARMTGNGTLWELTFTVKEDLESQTLPLKLVCLKATVNEDTTAMPATVDGTIAVKGVTPTLTAVTLPVGSDTVTVTGSGDSQIIQAKAASAKGTDLTTSVAWSVSPADGGVSIDAAAGVITVDNKAKAGNYTIKAAPKDGKVQGGAQSATLTVVRDRKPGYILPLESKTVEIPVAGTNTVDLITGVYDQFGEKLDGKIPTFDCSELNEIPGISTKLQDNVLSVSVGPDAKNAIPSSKTYTIKMSYEGLEDRNVQLTIRRAAAEVKSVEINGGAATIAVPTKAEAPKEIPYTATVQDQYGSSTGNAVTWDLKDAPDGVEIDQTGKVTVKTAAVDSPAFYENQLTFYVTATCGTVTKEKAVVLTRDAYEITYMEIDGADALEILTDKNNTAEYTVVDGKDQYGGGMTVPADNVEWSISPAVNGVSINKSTGVLTVTKDAAEKITTTAGQKFTITAKYSTEVSAVKTITVKRAESVATSLTVAQTSTNQGPFVVPGRDASEVYIDFTATVLDQYGSAMQNQNVTWSILQGTTVLENHNQIMSIFGGRVNVANAAKQYVPGTEPVTFTVKAELGELSNTAEFQLKRADSVLDSFNLYKREGTNGKFTLVSQDMIVVPSDDTTKTFQYMAKPVDQYGAEMSTDVAYTLKLTRTKGGVSELVDGLTFDADTKIGTLTVTKASPTTQTETLEIGIHAKPSTGAVDTFHDITFSHKDPVKVTVDGTLALTYGDERGITATVEKANAKAKWTWTSSDPSVVTASGSTTAATLRAHKAGSATITVTYEDDSRYGTATIEVTVAKKTLTVSAGTAYVTKTYSGNNGAAALQGSLEIEGLIKNDKPLGWTVLTFPNVNVGSGKLTVTLKLKSENGGDNYTLAQSTVEVPYTITPARLSLGTVEAVDRDYIAGDKTVSTSVTFDGLVNRETLTPGTDYTVSAVMADPNAGTNKKVFVTVVLTDSAAARNYTFASGNTASGNTNVTIGKIAYMGTTTASTSAKYGNTATLDLSALGLPEGYDFAQGTVQDENGILAGAEAAGYYVISGNTLRVPLVNNAAKAGKTATITIPISSTNYENFDLVITVTVNDKLENSLAARDISLTYGDTGYVTVTSIIGSLRTEIVSGDDVISLDNGTIKTLKAGTATLKLTASGDENYAEKSIQVKVTVSPKPITLKIDDKSAYVNDVLPALTYKVNGLVGADVLTTEPVLFVDVAEGVDPMKQVGTYAIKTSVTPSAGDNYSLTVAEGTLSVTNRPSAITPVGPSAGTVRVDETEGGTVRVTPANAAEGSTVTIVVTPDQGQELRSLEVLDKDGDSLELTDLGVGRFSFEMPRGKVTVKAEFGKAGLPYNDVKEGDWFYSAVEYVTEAGLMGDTGHGSFEPNTNTTRAMIWAILARLSGVDTTPVSGPWYSVAQEWAMNSGVSDGTNPNGAITREQLVTMLYRYAETHGIDVTEGGMAIREFADVERVSSFAGPAMTWAVNTGLISGIDGKLVPQGLATRSQVATVLMRFAQLVK